MIFIWLIYKLFKSSNSEPDVRMEFIKFIGITFSLIFIDLIHFTITRKLIKKIIHNCFGSLLLLYLRYMHYNTNSSIHSWIHIFQNMFKINNKDLLFWV